MSDSPSITFVIDLNTWPVRDPMARVSVCPAACGRWCGRALPALKKPGKPSTRRQIARRADVNTRYESRLSTVSTVRNGLSTVKVWTLFLNVDNDLRALFMFVHTVHTFLCRYPKEIQPEALQVLPVCYLLEWVSCCNQHHFAPLLSTWPDLVANVCAPGDTRHCAHRLTLCCGRTRDNAAHTHHLALWHSTCPAVVAHRQRTRCSPAPQALCFMTVAHHRL